MTKTTSIQKSQKSERPPARGCRLDLSPLADFLERRRPTPAPGLRQSLRLLAGGGPNTLFLEGPPGAGKTSVLAAFQDWLCQRPYRVARVDCRRNAFSALETLRRILAAARDASGPDAQALGRKYRKALSEFVHREPLPHPDDRVAYAAAIYHYSVPLDYTLSENTVGLIREIISYLLELAAVEEQPLVVLVDNAHWADPWSMMFFTHLSRRNKLAPLTACLTSDSQARRKSKVIRDFLKVTDCLHLRVEAGGLLRSGSTGRAAAKPKAGGDRPRQDRAAGLHPSRINRHWDALSRREQAVLEWLAVWEDPVEEPRLARAVGREDAGLPVAATLRGLRAKSLVARQSEQGRVRWRIKHEVWDAFLGSSTPAVRRRHLHRHVARMLEEELRGVSKWSLRQSDLFNRMYRHYLEAGDWLKLAELAPAYYSCPANTHLDHARENLERLRPLITTETETGKELRKRTVFQLRDIYQKQRETRKGMHRSKEYLRMESDPAKRAKALADQSVLYTQQGTEEAYASALEAAEAGYQEAAKIDDEVAYKDTVAYIHNSKALTHYRRKELAKTLELENEALRLSKEVAEASNGRLGWLQETVLYNLGTVYRKLKQDPDAAHRYYASTLDAVGDRGRVEVRAERLRLLGDCLYEVGRHEEALGHYLQCATVSEGHRQLAVMAMVANKSAGLCLHHLGRFNESSERFLKSLRLAIDLTGFLEIAGLLCNLGLNHYLGRDYSQAFSYYASAMRVKKRGGLKKEAAKGWVDLGLVCLKSGHFQAAGRLFEKGSRAYDSLGRAAQARQCSSAAAQCFRKARQRAAFAASKPAVDLVDHCRLETDRTSGAPAPGPKGAPAVAQAGGIQ